MKSLPTTVVSEWLHYPRLSCQDDVITNDCRVNMTSFVSTTVMSRWRHLYPRLPCQYDVITQDCHVKMTSFPTTVMSTWHHYPRLSCQDDVITHECDVKRTSFPTTVVSKWHHYPRLSCQDDVITHDCRLKMTFWYRLKVPCRPILIHVYLTLRYTNKYRSTMAVSKLEGIMNEYNLNYANCSGIKHRWVRVFSLHHRPRFMDSLGFWHLSTSFWMLQWYCFEWTQESLSRVYGLLIKRVSLKINGGMWLIVYNQQSI